MSASMVTMSPTGRVATAAPYGDLDVATAPALREALLEACRSTAALVVLDLRQVRFADSTAIGVMLSAHKRLESQGCRFIAVNIPPVLATALRALGLVGLLDVWTPAGRLERSIR